MKKRIVSILCLLLLLISAFPCKSVIATETSKKNISHFSFAIENLNQSNESYRDSFSEAYNENNPNASENRLIVKTNETINNTEAVDSVNGLGYSVLQYDDKDTMEEEYKTLLEKGYSVEKDRVLKINKDNHLLDFRTDDLDGPNERWAYESVLSDEAKSMIESQRNTNDITVGVFDSGVDYNHEALAGRIVDTSFNMSASGNENDCMDDNGHGTAVAGIIAECTPSNVKIKPYKVVDSDGYMTLTEFIVAMETIIASNNKPDIMNMSIGGYLFDDDMGIETELVNELIDCGVTVCIASGNDNLPTQYCTPAESKKGIVVGAYNYTNHICSFSNYGKIDIAAPGDCVRAPIYESINQYDNDWEGTSFSCPFASAACAYILMQNPNYTPSQVKNTLKTSAVFMGDDNAPYYGSGMVNFVNLIDELDYETPNPSITGGSFNNTQTVSFDNIPNDAELIYTLDKSIPSSENGTIYSSSITIDNEMQMNYALIENGKYKSPIKSQYYTIQYSADESDFEIDSNGTITAYNGYRNNIIIPDTINTVVPISIGENAFENSDLVSVLIPKSVTQISSNAFNAAKELKHIIASGVVSVENEAFKNCFSLLNENMPLIETVGSNSFYSCYMLHNISFEESLTTINEFAFRFAGISNLTLPKLIMNDNTSKGAFYETPIVSFYAQKVTRLSAGLFFDCNFLNNVYSPILEHIYESAICNTYYLNELDLSNLVSCQKNAFSRSYVDTLYAPKLKSLTDLQYSNPGLGRKAFIRIINLPAIETIDRHFLYDMLVEEVYMNSLTIMDRAAFTNLPLLNILKLPKTSTFYFPQSDKTGSYPGIGPLEVLWLPNANFGQVSDLPKTTRIVFAPNCTTIGIQTTSKETTIYVSEKATDFSVDYTHDMYLAGDFPTIVAPLDSTAGRFVAGRNADTSYSLPINYGFIDTSSLVKDKGGQIRLIDNGLRFGFFWNELDKLQKYADKIEYGFEYGYCKENEAIANQLDKRKIANNRVFHKDVNNTTFNLVFTNIPSQSLDKKISVRAYVDIDGMRFYSNTVTKSYNDVANCIINDKGMPENIKEQLKNQLNDTI